MVRRNADEEEDPDADLTRLLGSLEGEEEEKKSEEPSHPSASNRNRKEQHRHSLLAVNPFALFTPKARSSPRNGASSQSSSSSPLRNCVGSASSSCRYVGAWIHLACHYHPWICASLLMILLLGIVLLIPSYLFNPTEVYGLSAYDQQQVTHIHSKYDLEMWKIDHWCLGGGDDDCQCQDPLAPQPRLQLSNASRDKNQAWIEAWKRNRKVVQHYAEMTLDRSNNFGGVDVAFVGESVVEAMGGRWMGMQPTDDLKVVEEQFRQRFQSANSPFQGVALGIAGDTAPNVLWRLIQDETGSGTTGGGELTTPGFEPSVYWLVLGSNDLARMQCSEEIVLLGILRVVEEILLRRPDAYIVINSILPMYQLRGARDPYLSDINDTFDGPTTPMATIPPVPEEFLHNRRLSFRSRNYAYSDPNRKKEPQKKPKPTLLRPPDDDIDSADMMAEIKAKEVRREEQRKHEEEAKKRKKFFGNNNKPLPWQPAYYGKPVKPSFNGNQQQGRNSAPDYRLDPAVNRMKKFKRGHFGRRQENHIPLFTSIDAVNHALETFAKEEDRVEFFDATNIFAFTNAGTTTGTKKGRKGHLKKKPKTYFQLNSARISVRGHPTVAGYSAWEDAILRRLQRIQRDRPELFHSHGGEGTDDVFHMTHAFDDDEYDDVDLHQLYGGLVEDMSLGGTGFHSGFHAPTEETDSASRPDVNAYTDHSACAYGCLVGKVGTENEKAEVLDLTDYDIGVDGMVKSSGGGVP